MAVRTGKALCVCDSAAAQRPALHWPYSMLRPDMLNTRGPCWPYTCGRASTLPSELSGRGTRCTCRHVLALPASTVCPSGVTVAGHPQPQPQPLQLDLE